MRHLHRVEKRVLENILFLTHNVPNELRVHTHQDVTCSEIVSQLRKEIHCNLNPTDADQRYKLLIAKDNLIIQIAREMLDLLSVVFVECGHNDNYDILLDVVLNDAVKHANLRKLSHSPVMSMRDKRDETFLSSSFCDWDVSKRARSFCFGNGIVDGETLISTAAHELLLMPGGGPSILKELEELVLNTGYALGVKLRKESFDTVGEE